MKRFVWGQSVFFIIVLLLPCFVFAENINLKSGNNIEGSVISIDKDGITVNVQYGEIKIDIGELAEKTKKKYYPQISSNSLDEQESKSVIKDKPETQANQVDLKNLPSGKYISKEDIEYLERIAFDTWRFISDFIDNKTGLPFDNSSRADYTSVSNIAVYLASIQVAKELGFITRSDALQSVIKIVEALEKHPKWKGFPSSWIKVRSIGSSDKKISVVDSGHLALSLILVGEVFPELKSRTQALLDKMKWDVFYDKKTGWFKGGYDLNANKFMDFSYAELGSDVRSASIVAVGSGKVPLDHWQSLMRDLEERYEIRYLGPGWRAGGLFLQFLTSLFIDERYSLIGNSAANAAYAQIIHAKKKDYPLWGWSASLAPNGSYLGMNQIIDDVVTPHAVILAISYYPLQVINNLKIMEKYKARKPFFVRDEEIHYGFRDAIGMKKQQIAGKYLMLDQCMIFVSLGNFLKEGCIWNKIRLHPWIQKIYKDLPEFQLNLEEVKELRRILRDRDEKDFSGDIISLDLQIKDPIIKPYVEVKMLKSDIIFNDKVAIDGELDDWSQAKEMKYELHQTLESGVVTDEKDLSAQSWLMWDEKNLYFAIKVIDQDLRNEFVKEKIYKGDVVELFVDPQKNKLVWGNPRDFQIGFNPVSKNKNNQLWAWFQRKQPSEKEVKHIIKKNKHGYIIEAAISWEFLKIKPKENLSFALSAAVHDVDFDAFPETKINWCYFSKEGYLGDVTLRKQAE